MVSHRINWEHRGEYIRTRSQRRVGDTDIEPAWADEAVADPDAARLVPDPASKSGQTIRVIGYSVTAGLVVTVILLPTEDEVIGVNAWKANDSDIRRYRKG